MDLKALKHRVLTWVWGAESSEVSAQERFARGLVQYLWVMVRDLSEGQLNMRAMSLVYTSLLSLVPLLAVSFSVLKAFGVHNQIEPFLFELLKPLGDQGVMITDTIIGFVDNIRVGILGAVGVAFLFYVVLALIEKVETALNFAWRVQRKRNMAKRLSDTMGFLLLGPVLAFAIIAGLANATEQALVKEALSVGWLSTAYGYGLRLLPTALMVGAVSLIYLIIPNTRVRLFPALIGALIAVVAWQIIGWGFATFVVKSGQYTAVYSAFAALMLFMVWMYLTWLILLLGARIAFYLQYPQYLSLQNAEQAVSARLREQSLLNILVLVGQYFDEPKGAGWLIERLAERLKLPLHVVEELVQYALDKGLLVEAHDPNRLLPARRFDGVMVSEVLNDYRVSSADSAAKAEVSVPAVSRLMDALDRQREEHLSGLSLSDLARRDADEP